MRDDNFFKLFSYNIPVTGKEKSVIYNLQKSRLVYIPNSMLKVIRLLEQKTIKEAKEIVGEASSNLFEEYLLFLQKYDLGFFTLYPGEFPELDKKWNSPNEIMNAVVEYDFIESTYDLHNTFIQLEVLQCFHIELRIKNVTANNLSQINHYTDGEIFKSITVVIEFNNDIIDALQNFYDNNQKIDSILVYNTISSYNDTPGIKHTPLSIHSSELLFPADHYILHVKYFTESLYFHPFFNKKVCIDLLGDIKNDLRFPATYGNIRINSIKEVLTDTDFKALWYAAPDKVIEYRDDHLRYCRLHTDNLIKVENGLYKVRST